MLASLRLGQAKDDGKLRVLESRVNTGLLEEGSQLVPDWLDAVAVDEV